tara:strand:- start:2526 stop:3272 length:747 start_codon:yes stop_codon:yes gene_type:complete
MSSIKISAKALTALYPDTKFAGVKRTMAKVFNRVQKSQAETNLAVDTIEKTFQTKLKIMNTLSNEVSGYNDAKEGGFQGGLVKWITTSPELQKTYIEKKYDSNVIIPEVQESDRIESLGGDSEKDVISNLEDFTNDAAKSQDLDTVMQDNKVEMQNNSGNLSPIKGFPSSDEVQINRQINDETNNNPIDLGTMPTIDEIIASKDKSQKIVDNSTNDDEKAKAQNNINWIEKFYENAIPFNGTKLEDLY